MFDRIRTLAKRLFVNSAKDSELLREVAELITDEDYRTCFLEEVAANYVALGRLEEAQLAIDGTLGLEKSRALSRIARNAVRAGHSEFAEHLFDAAVEATSANRFPTERAIALFEVAEALREIGLVDRCATVLQSAVAEAAPAQDADSVPGLEASGALLMIAQLAADIGQRQLAREAASSIAPLSMKDRAGKFL